MLERIGYILIKSEDRDEVVDYVESAKSVIRKLLEVLLEGLKVKQIDKAREYTLMGSPIVNLMYYPHCPNPDFTAGVRPHSDISALTVLLQDDNGGLYVRATQNDSWIHVLPINGALVINIGDILQIMSNDRYKSIEHRVVANGSKDSFSAYFCESRTRCCFRSSAGSARKWGATIV